MNEAATLPPRREPGPVTSALLIAATTAVVLLALDSLRIAGTPLLGAVFTLETHFYYALLGLLLPFVFLLYRSNPRWDVVWLDVLLAVTAAACATYLFIHSEQILDEGWEFVAPAPAIVASAALWLLALEAVRRAGGTTLFVLVTVFSFYPLFADRMPEVISGIAVEFAPTAAYHAMSIESLLGLPFRAFANLVIGFLVFGVALQHTGGGKFFIDLAFALLGHVRGGPAKVAIVSSGLMGSMSGSVITNVVTTGQLTIPAMKNSGIEPRTAAGVEACASTGGVLLPPIMGSTAFVMATFLERPYYEVALAAALPALLYFAALFIQIDRYAAREKLAGLPAAELPGVRGTLRDGWYYIGAFVLLIVLLLVLQREALAPWAATGALLILNQISATHRFNLKQFREFVLASGALLVELLAILAGVGLIVGALSVTGLSGTLINELLFLAGGSTIVLLVMGALTSFVLGIGMTVTAAYIFLAIVLAPALVEGGLSPMAVHLFILYWGMLSFITPPVALGAFAAASIAAAPPVATGFTAMRLGAATYLIPFLFVINPALVLEGSTLEAALALIEGGFGLLLLAAGLQRHAPIIGELEGTATATLLALGGAMIALPDLAPAAIPLSNLAGNIAGVGLAIAAGLVGWRQSRAAV